MVKSSLTKSSLFLMFLFLIGIHSFISFRPPITNNSCVYDLGFRIFSSITSYFTKNIDVKNGFIIVSSLLMDILIISSLVTWFFYSESWHFIISAFLFYGTRALIQHLYMLPYPRNHLFDYPGVFSLSVGYQKTNDFFYSGHVGIPIICAYEFKQHEMNYMHSYALFVLAFEFMMMITVRGHYTIDMIIGVIFATYIYKVVTMFIGTIDDSCISLRNTLISFNENRNKELV